MLKLLNKFFVNSVTNQSDQLEKSLIRHESKIGSQIFGPVEKGHQRDFFCLDQNTWVWHEQINEKGKSRSILTRYEVRPIGILKSQNGGSYQKVSDNEARNLFRAAQLYYQKVSQDYQTMLQN